MLNSNTCNHVTVFKWMSSGLFKNVIKKLFTNRIHLIYVREGLAKNNPHKTQPTNCPVDWSCRIHWLHLCKEVRPPSTNEYPGYDTKQSDGEVPVILELWGMRGTPSLLSLSDPLWPGMVAPDSHIYGPNRTKLCTYAKLNCLTSNCFWHWNCVLMLNWTVWNRTKLCTHAKMNCLK